MGLDDALARSEASSEQSAAQQAEQDVLQAEQDALIVVACRQFADVCRQNRIPTFGLTGWNSRSEKPKFWDVARGWLVSVPWGDKKGRSELVFVSDAGEWLGARYFRGPKYGKQPRNYVLVQGGRPAGLTADVVETAMADFIVTNRASAKK